MSFTAMNFMKCLSKSETPFKFSNGVYSTTPSLFLSNDGPAWSFSSPGVGVSPLTAKGQRFSMAKPSVGTDIH